MYIYIKQEKTARIENLKKIVPRTFEEHSIIGWRIFRAEHWTFNITSAGANDCSGDAVYLLPGVRPERNSRRVWNVRWIFDQTYEFGFRMNPHRIVRDAQGRDAEIREAQRRQQDCVERLRFRQAAHP